MNFGYLTPIFKRLKPINYLDRFFLNSTLHIALDNSFLLTFFQAFANPEDVKGNEANAKVDLANDDVERVRRCHQVIIINF